MEAFIVVVMPLAILAILSLADIAILGPYLGKNDEKLLKAIIDGHRHVYEKSYERESRMFHGIAIIDGELEYAPSFIARTPISIWSKWYIHGHGCILRWNKYSDVLDELELLNLLNYGKEN